MEHLSLNVVGTKKQYCLKGFNFVNLLFCSKTDKYYPCNHLYLHFLVTIVDSPSIHDNRQLLYAVLSNDVMHYRYPNTLCELTEL